jgi:Putative peptidoglycan binding domain
MLLLHKLPRFIAIVLLISGYVVCNHPSVEAKGRKGSRKGKRVTANTRGRSLTRASYNRSSSRSGRKDRTDGDLAVGAYHSNSTVPDNIEVIENGSSNSKVISRLTDLPKPEETTDSPNRVKPVKLRMDSSRVVQIQRALAKQGFYQGDATGRYDEATVDAMRRFQSDERIPITGYPTVPALKRLGLAR